MALKKLGKKLGGAAKKVAKNTVGGLGAVTGLSSLLGGGQNLPDVPDSSPLQQALRESIAKRQQLLESGLKEQGDLSTGLSTDLASMINAAGQEQQNLIRGLRPQLSPLSESLRSQTSAEAARARQEAARMGQDLTNVPTELADRQSAQLRQQVLEAQPEAQQQLREALAASGQLRTGRAARGAQDLAVQAQRAITTGQENIQQQALADQLRARELAFQNDANFLERELGLNQDVIQAIFNSGREDLISEANALIGEAQQRNQGLQQNRQDLGERQIGLVGARTGGLSQLEQEQNAGVSGFQQSQQEQQYARELANTQNRNNRRNQLINTGLQLGGMVFGGPAGAQAGNVLANTISGQNAPAVAGIGSNSPLTNAFRRKGRGYSANPNLNIRPQF